ncbi:MAG: hypothetical protein VKJ04_09145 [Vampirovibrionales bacterium]|nr:hypothetical protein [Vampirovibrionales bacterium]
MQRCPVCQGRTIKTESGARCMKADCEGTAQLAAQKQEGVECRCGEMMDYGGLDSYGAPLYYCSSCGARTKL